MKSFDNFLKAFLYTIFSLYFANMSSLFFTAITARISYKSRTMGMFPYCNG